MLDAGNRLEADRAQAVERLGGGQPEEFDPKLLAFIKENMPASPEGVPLKVSFGSDFPYRGHDTFLPMEAPGFAAFPSLALGGLGNVWGASMLPVLQDDIDDWPISLADLAPHYAAVLSFVPLSGARDRLASTHPLYSDRYAPLRPSRQIANFMKDLEASGDALAAEGITFGASRLAVRAQSDGEGQGCLYCGLCMYGCPYGAIYNPATAVEQLRKRDSFTYLDGIVVEKVVEGNGRVRVESVSTTDGSKAAFDADRVYLAAGVLPTTRILLHSMGAYEVPVTIRDSQYYLIPLLRYRTPGDVERERLHTLAQTFIEIRDERIADRSVHLQVYSYNDLLPSAVGSFLGPMARIAGPAISQVVGRLLIVQGYLHSDLSSEVKATLRSPRGGERPTLQIEVRPVPATRRAISGVLAKLARNRRHFQALPVTPMAKTALAGRGYHSGGTFPMSASPSGFQSDRLGRPAGFKRVHVVDSTVLPSVPATTITLTVMANAHRIGSAYDGR
jgi:choline dehydrogenase-like flavoprotein